MSLKFWLLDSRFAKFNLLWMLGHIILIKEVYLRSRSCSYYGNSVHISYIGRVKRQTFLQHCLMICGLWFHCRFTSLILHGIIAFIWLNNATKLKLYEIFMYNIIMMIVDAQHHMLLKKIHIQTWVLFEFHYMLLLLLLCLQEMKIFLYFIFLW